MSQMPPTCTDCHERDATAPDGWCDECAKRWDEPTCPEDMLDRLPDVPPAGNAWSARVFRDVFAPSEPYRFPF